MKYLLALLFPLALSVHALNIPVIKPVAAESGTENYPYYKKLLQNPPPGATEKQNAENLVSALQRLSRMNEPEEFDFLLELVRTKYAESVPVVLALYDKSNVIPSYGYRIGESFTRGNNRGGYGVFLNCAERDRVRLLRLFDHLYRKNPDALPAEFYAKFAALWFTGRNDSNSWKLQQKTALNSLPDYEENMWKDSSFSRPPVGKNSLPVFYNTPKSYDDAANDGERFQFFRKLAHDRKNIEADRIYADFLARQFQVERNDAESRRVLETLSDSETIAQLANGIMRFRMPDEHNFILLYKELKDWRALANIYLGRGQMEKALEMARRAGEKELVRQISGNFGSLEPLRILPAGTEPELKFCFRNARAGTVSIQRIDEAKLMKALLAAHSKPQKNEVYDLYSLPVPHLLKEYSGSLGPVIAKIPLKLNPLPRHAETETKIALPLKNAGAWLVTVALENGNTSQIIVWMTDYMFTLASSNLLAPKLLLNRASDGAPITGKKVDFRFFRNIYSRNPEEMEKHGRVRIVTKNLSVISANDGSVDLPQEKKMNNFWAFAEFNGKYAFYSGWSPASGRNPGVYERSRAFMLTDRPVYKPGDKVKFSGFIRLASYTEMTEKYPSFVTVKVREPRGKILYTSKMPVSPETGAFSGRFTLPEEAALGHYSIGAEKFGSIAFRVEEYKKPEYEVKLDIPSKPVRLGETVTAALHADYYFGAPVSGAEVRGTVIREVSGSYIPLVSSFSWLYGNGCELPSTCYTWKCFPWYSDREVVTEFSGKTAADGTFSIRIPTKLSADRKERNYRYSIKAEVTDSSRKVISASGSLIAAAKPFELFIYAVNGFRRPNEVTTLKVEAVDPNGKPVEGTGLIRLYRAKLSDDLKYENDGPVLRSIPFKNGENPSFVTNRAGIYRAVAEFRGKDGWEDSAACIIRIMEDNGADGMFSELPIEISLDKPMYQPGETVKILISANRPDADVYLCLGGTMRHLKLKDYSALVTHKVTEADQPNIFAAAATIRNGTVHHVTKQICIPPEKRMLNVKLDVPKQPSRPRSTVPVDLTITDLNGKPVSGVFALTVYDKSLEAVAGNNIPSIQQFFWSWKRFFYLNLQSGILADSWPYSKDAMQRFYGFGSPVAYSDMSPGMLRSNRVLYKSKAAPAAMAPEGMGAGTEADEAFIRSDFADSIFWIGQHEFDSDGRVRVMVPVPDNLTTWVVRAWSIGSRTSVGEARAEFVVSKEIIARLEMPSFLTEGDTADALAVVHNYSKRPVRAKVELTVPEKEVSVISKSRTVIIEPDVSVTLPFHIRAEQEGMVKPTLAVRIDGKLADGVSLSLPVKVRGIQKHVPFAGRIQNQIATIHCTVPSEIRGGAELAIDFAPGAATAVIDLLPSLLTDKSEDVFGVVSRFLPALKAAYALRGINIPLETALRRADVRKELYKSYRSSAKNVSLEKNMERVIASSLKMIQGMVNSDGGWGWFSGYGERSWPDTTAAVVNALLDVKEMGRGEVDARVLSRGIAWLEAEARSRAASRKFVCGNSDALVLRTLARAGKRSEALEKLVFKEREQLSPLGLATLGLALKDGSPEQKTVLKELSGLLKQEEQTGTAYLNIPSAWRFSWCGNDTATQTAYLELLLRTEPESRLTEAVARYLTINLRNAPSRTSLRALGEAVGVLARYIQISGEGAPDNEVSVKIDGVTVASFRITEENLWKTDFRAVVPAEQLLPGAHEVEISCTGKGAVMYYGMLSYFTREPRISAAGLELTLQRRYWLIEPAQNAGTVPGRFGQSVSVRREAEKRILLNDLSSVKPGDIVEVELIPSAKNDYDYTEFADCLPAGFEYVNPKSGYISYFPSIYAEFRTEGPHFYLRNLTHGVSAVRYRIRARFDGSYTALPATGRGVYAPALRANSNDMIIKIKEK